MTSAAIEARIRVATAERVVGWVRMGEDGEDGEGGEGGDGGSDWDGNGDE